VPAATPVPTGSTDDDGTPDQGPGDDLRTVATAVPPTVMGDDDGTPDQGPGDAPGPQATVPDDHGGAGTTTSGPGPTDDHGGDGRSGPDGGGSSGSDGSRSGDDGGGSSGPG
jgi:hypothetical protein